MKKGGLESSQDIKGASEWSEKSAQVFYLLENEEQREWNYNREKGSPKQITLKLPKSRFNNETFVEKNAVWYRPWCAEFKYGGPILNTKKTK
jgi:hypothetical protein